ncbi:MAG: GAF domain-containing protein, partial [Terriglobales bacterium]
MFKELRARNAEITEALEQQTATSEILRVISSSPTDLQPVFDAILENATRLCDAHLGTLGLYDGVKYQHVAQRGANPAFIKHIFRGPFHPDSAPTIGRMIAERRAIHVPDLGQAPHYRDGNPAAVATYELGGGRTVIAVPMLKEGRVVGGIFIYRPEVRPFTQKQIDIVSTFANQAVIAIENVRLFNETKEALERQTATSEVLKVISSSPGDLEPVFQTMLENAVRICEAKFGTMFRYDGKAFHRAAGVGTPPALVEFQRQRGPFPPNPGSRLHDLVQTKQVGHTVDAAADAGPGASANFGGARSQVHVPMLKDDELVGVIIIYRQEVRPFTDKQIELVKNFAAQA